MPHYTMGHISGDEIGQSSIDFSTFSIPTSIVPALPSEAVRWNMPTSTSLSQHTPDENNMADSPYWIGYVDCGCPSPHIQFSAIPRDYRDRRTMDTGLELAPFNPNSSVIHVGRICIAEAVMTNCAHIGITQEMFCKDDAVSPFYRPRGKTNSVTGFNAVVQTVQNIFQAINPDLRPSREQIEILHHPIIDILPFPKFRTNLITNIDTIDDEELYFDLLNGLVCWGGAGVGKRNRGYTTGYICSGTPWDSKSWEARTWFIQKYWVMLGGEEGELVRQSQWWRNMRGEYSDIWTGL
jgi:hypothetical protein